MATRDRLRVHWADINPLVVRFTEGFRRRTEKKLNLLFGIQCDQASADLHRYFLRPGLEIGYEAKLDLPAPLALHLAKSRRVRDDVHRWRNEHSDRTLRSPTLRMIWWSLWRNI
jgi:hypothetical protein